MNVKVYLLPKLDFMRALRIHWRRMEWILRAFLLRPTRSEQPFSTGIRGNMCVATNNSRNYWSKRWQHPIVVSSSAIRSSNRGSHSVVYRTSGMELLLWMEFRLPSNAWQIIVMVGEDEAILIVNEGQNKQ